MISLCSFVRNEEDCVANMIESVRDFVQEIIIVDTGSTDKTIDICRGYGARIYQVGFTDFGSIRTLTAHLATKEYCLMLDADETLSDPYILRNLVALGRAAYALPRKRWLDLEMTDQTERDAYPDLQVRFFKNNKDYIFRRELHEEFHGAAVSQVSHPCINHFHDVYKNFQRKQERLDLYTRLSRIAGVSIEGGKKL